MINLMKKNKYLWFLKEWNKQRNNYKKINKIIGMIDWNYFSYFSYYKGGYLKFKLIKNRDDCNLYHSFLILILFIMISEKVS
jgi:hypothetical protein